MRIILSDHLLIPSYSGRSHDEDDGIHSAERKRKLFAAEDVDMGTGGAGGGVGNGGGYAMGANRVERCSVTAQSTHDPRKPPRGQVALNVL